MAQTKDFGRFYTHELWYAPKAEGEPPYLERAYTREVEPPYREGSGFSFRWPGKRYARVIGRWGKPPAQPLDADELDGHLAEAMELFKIEVTPEEIAKWDGTRRTL